MPVSTTKQIPPKEDVEAALIDSIGNFSAAARQFKDAKGNPINHYVFRKWVDHYDLDYYPVAVRKTIAKKALSIVQQKAFEEGDVKCLFKILDSWGKYIGFDLPTIKADVTITEAEKVLEEALIEIKEAPHQKDLVKLRQVDMKPDEKFIDQDVHTLLTDPEKTKSREYNKKKQRMYRMKSYKPRGPKKKKDE